MKVVLAVGGFAFGVATWGILALWAPDISVVFFLRTLEPAAVISIAGVAAVIIATRLLAFLARGRMQSGMALFSALTPPIMLGGYAVFLLIRIVDAVISLPEIPADIVAPNAANVTMMISLALLFAAISLEMHDRPRPGLVP
ncbi:hypothetical protein [Brevundimonas diminuta]|uniref:hypothetical protein n=1 Tax=Brevundimonas diminuta TaxID=293 RepID=UPI003D013109